MDPYVWKRLWRRPWLTLCGVVLSAVLCFLLCFLSGYQQAQQEKLKETQESFQVLCVLSNRRGTQTHGLRMGSVVYYIATSPEMGLLPYIHDLRMTKELEASCAQLGIAEGMLLGVTNERCADALDAAMGGGIVEMEEGFFESDELICLVSQEKYAMLGAEKTVTLFVKDPRYNPEYGDWPGGGAGAVPMRVAGCYAGRGDEVFMPFRAAWDLGYTLSGSSCVDSLAFVAADNLALDALKEAAMQHFGQVDPLADDNADPRIALTVHDEQYRAAVAVLEQNIRRTGYLLPLVVLLGLGVGFLVSFLATRGESRTYALMRTLGMTKRKLFFSVLREQVLLALPAVPLALALTGRFLPAAGYLLCHVMGCCAAVVRAVRIGPTAILREQE